MIQILLALIAGMLTVGAPCILPLLPILLGASVGQQSKTRPIFIALGFIVMFSVAGLTLSYIVTSLMISPNILRNIAVVGLGLFGLLMVWPLPFEILTTKLSGLINTANQTARKAGTGNFGGFILGVMLGLIWTPCAGPVLGSILTLIATQTELASATVLLITYALGAGLPMLIIAYGGQYITSRVSILARYSRRLQQIFGVIILLLAVAIWQQYDIKFQAKLLEKFDFVSLESKIIKPLEKQIMLEPDKVNQDKPINEEGLKNYGPAPEIIGINNWLNSSPLTLQSLRGKVVLVDFWTYSCINCVRTLPYVTKWYETYKDQGFVIIGVHTPEFAFEKDAGNVATAIKRHNITYPVAQDNDYATWNNYANRYWPAHYLIDKDGLVRYAHFGEGKYEETEAAIQTLLGLRPDGSQIISNERANTQAKSPEMYFGTDRIKNLVPGQYPSPQTQYYPQAKKIDPSTFAINGSWYFAPDKAVTDGPNTSIWLRFAAQKVFMVASSAKPQKIKIINKNGQLVKEINVDGATLYTLFENGNSSDDEIQIEIPEAGFEAYTFTFG